MAVSEMITVMAQFLPLVTTPNLIQVVNDAKSLPSCQCHQLTLKMLSILFYNQYMKNLCINFLYDE